MRGGGIYRWDLGIGGGGDFELESGLALACEGRRRMGRGGTVGGTRRPGAGGRAVLRKIAHAKNFDFPGSFENFGGSFGGAERTVRRPATLLVSWGGFDLTATGGR
jgi:hypothetical protein